MISMPVANSAVLFATEYDGDVSLAAKTVFMTTLLSVVTIPLIDALCSSFKGVNKNIKYEIELLVEDLKYSPPRIFSV